MMESGTTAIAMVQHCAEPACNQPAHWRPLIHVFNFRGIRIPGEATIDRFLVCKSHQVEATNSIVQDDECWLAIAKAFSNHGRPVRDKTVIVYEEM